MNNIDEERALALEKENQLLRSIIDSIHEGVYAIDEKRVIILYNAEVEKSEGIKREYALGKQEEEVYAFLENSFYEMYEKEVLRAGQPVIEQYFKYSLPDGRIINMIMSIYPFFYKGKLAGAYTIGRDTKQIDDFITKILELQRKVIMQTHKDSKTGARFFLDNIVGVSDKIRETIAFARKIASRYAPVLIVGETGTGKELFAQGIHNASLCSKGPFVPVNCAAIPDTLLESVLFGTVKGSFTGAGDIPGLFEQAENGTIFLDEINSMPLPAQAKLLRVIQDKVVRRIGSNKEIPINCRIISATNIDPFVDNPQQVIRSDLLFRLSSLVVKVPTLRDRIEDIDCLCAHIIMKYNVKYKLAVSKVSNELLALFKKYHWPGNIRELESVIESSMSFVDFQETVLDIQHLPEYLKERLAAKSNPIMYPIDRQETLHNIMKEMERKIIEEALKRNNWNVSKTAEGFGILRQNLHQKIRNLGISRTE